MKKLFCLYRKTSVQENKNENSKDENPEVVERMNEVLTKKTTNIPEKAMAK